MKSSTLTVCCLRRGRSGVGCFGDAFQANMERVLVYSGRKNGVQSTRRHTRNGLCLLLMDGYGFTVDNCSCRTMLQVTMLQVHYKSYKNVVFKSYFGQPIPPTSIPLRWCGIG